MFEGWEPEEGWIGSACYDEAMTGPGSGATQSGKWALLLLLGAVFGPQGAGALPNTVNGSATDDDATVTITIWDAFILGDARSWCEVRIQVTNNAEPFRSGDTVEVKVRESEGALGVGDDDIWQTIFNVTPAQVSNGVDQTFDCSADFLDDTGSTSEIYAEARVVKDACGTFCAYDTPSTSSIDVAELTDDGHDDNAGDDNFGAAKTLANGLLSARIARDGDWYVIDALGPMAIDVSALHRPEGGRLDLGLFDSSGVDTGTAATDAGDRVRLQVANLALGTWYLRVLPRTASDFNFYDVDATLTDLTTTCSPGEQSSRPCGRCGTETRICSGAGEWGAYGACSSQGVCAPGERVNETCGNCGNKVTLCDDACTWVSDPVCSDEGPCVPNATEEQVCPGGGSQSRFCEATCTWSEWGTCSAPPLGSACVTDTECGTGLYCATEGGLFPGGYCTQVGCATDGECTPGFCVTAFGQPWCMAGCPMGTECRGGYLCVDTPSGKACQPPCRDDLDCWGNSATCGADGLCAGGGTTTGDGGSVVQAQGGCGCTADPSARTAAAGWGLLCLLLLLPLRRRR